MERVRAMTKLLEALDDKIHGLQQSATSLETSFGTAQRELEWRKDARLLDALKEMVLREADGFESSEINAQSAAASTDLAFAPLRLAIGTLKADVAGDRHPLAAGLRAMADSLRQVRPAGTIMVAVGERGLPQDVTVVCISRLARQRSSTEAKVLHSLREQGYVLFPPEDFVEKLMFARQRVYQGKTALPIPASDLLSSA